MLETVGAYLFVLILFGSVVLTITGILRWLADSDKRKERVRIVTNCAFGVLALCLMVLWWTSMLRMQGNDVDKALVCVPQVMVKTLIMLVIVAFSMILAAVVFLLVIYGVKMIFYTVFPLHQEESQKKNQKENLEEELQKKAERLISLLRSPIIIVIITGGMVAFCAAIPFAAGNQTDSLAECWSSGIRNLAGTSDSIAFGKAFGQYLMCCISVVGIGYAVFNMALKETLIRKELGYIFVMLIGQSTSLFIRTISVIYNAFNSMLNGNTMQFDSTDEHMERIHGDITGRILGDIEEELTRSNKSGEYKDVPFSPFEKKITKK